MFSIFSKKNFLVDHLEGFIDIHNHILPGIDDGAKNVEESLELLKGFSEFGVKDFICTPHIMENYYPNTPYSIKKSLAELENSLKMNALKDINIRVAAEHMIDSNFETILKENEVMPLANNYLLIEMSYLQASINFTTAIEKTKAKGLSPILAHPERYNYIKNNTNQYEEIKNRGLFFQLNLLSISGYYGKEVYRKAIQLLDSKLIDFVGTDIHNLNHLSHLKNIQLNTKLLKKLEPLIKQTSYNFS